MSKENYIEEIRPHDSAYKHVSGYADYTDDINEPKNTIYGAIGLSRKAHAIIKNYWLQLWLNSIMPYNEASNMAEKEGWVQSLPAYLRQTDLLI